MNDSAATEVVMRLMNDVGGTFAIALCYIGDKLGLFAALAEKGPVSAGELAQKTGLNERYVLEWLRAMVASQYAEYDSPTDRYFMTDAQKAVFVDSESPLYSIGPVRFVLPSVYNVPKLLDVFKNGGGIKYSEIGDEIPAAIEQFFRPGYRHNLVSKWLPAVPGLPERLRAGATVLDLGCGCGQSTVVMAEAFPASKFYGLDYDPSSINRARDLAGSMSLENVSFIQSEADNIPGGVAYDLICAFDCIHDMAKPRETLKAVCQALSPEGVFLWGEPNASGNPLENRNVIGRTFASCSPLHCLTVSLAYDGEGLGTIIGAERIAELAREAGFSKISRLQVDDPINAFYDVRR